MTTRSQQPPPSFSERIGLAYPRRELQLTDMDEGLKNGIWNWIYWMLDPPEDMSYRGDVRRNWWSKFAKDGLWDEFFHWRVDEIPSDVLGAVKQWYTVVSWNKIHDLAEYVLAHGNSARGDLTFRRKNPEEKLNWYLEREMSGYRAINGQLAPITSKAEIDAIRHAATPVTGFDPVAEHIDNALRLLSRKPEPDYRNSIKESISAVESAVKLLTGENSGGIDKALAILERDGHLHAAMKIGLSKLYAYTSDKDGVRHALLEEASVTFAEAKFMLVACSAFANFLIESCRTKTV